MEEITTNIFPTVKSLDAKKGRKEAYIELKFNDDLKPMLLELKKLFNKYDIKNIIPLRSVFSFRIFELLKQYESIGHREIRLEHLKEMLGIENKYSLYANFKRKVILQAQKDLVVSQDQIVGCLWRILHRNCVTEPALIATAIRPNLRLVPAQTTLKFNSTFKR